MGGPPKILLHKDCIAMRHTCRPLEAFKTVGSFSQGTTGIDGDSARSTGVPPKSYVAGIFGIFPCGMHLIIPRTCPELSLVCRVWGMGFVVQGSVMSDEG